MVNAHGHPRPWNSRIANAISSWISCLAPSRTCRKPGEAWANIDLKWSKVRIVQKNFSVWLIYYWGYKFHDLFWGWLIYYCMIYIYWQFAGKKMFFWLANDGIVQYNYCNTYCKPKNRHPFACIDVNLSEFQWGFWPSIHGNLTINRVGAPNSNNNLFLVGWEIGGGSFLGLPACPFGTGC